MSSTHEHPVYVPGRGWVVCRELEVGDELLEATGERTMVIAARYERHPRGIMVYNFRVAESHTYFVRENDSTAEPVWVHNACVYQSVEDGIVRYVGIADRGAAPSLAGRLAAAAERTPAATTSVVPGTEGVTAIDAESMEQALISYHGREGIELGGTLANIKSGYNVSPINTARGFKGLADIDYRGTGYAVHMDGSGI